MRVNPNNLTGAIQITPQSGGVDTFADVRVARLIPGEVLDLSGLSQTIARAAGQQQEIAQNLAGVEIEAIGSRVERGESLDSILAEYADTGKTPTRVRSQISKAFNAAGLDPAANPLYIQRFRAGQASIRSVAIRSKLLEPQVVESIVDSAKGLNGAEAYDTMLATLQAKIQETQPYEGLEGLGSSAMDERLLGITRETMQAVETRYTEKVKETSRLGFGAEVLQQAETYLGALAVDDDEVKDLALDTLVNAYTSMRTSGEPRPREVLLEAIVAIGEALGPKDPKGVAEMLEDVLEAKEGTAEIFGGDLEARATIATLVGKLERQAVERASTKDYDNRLRAQEVRRDLTVKYMPQILRAQDVGPDAVRSTFNALQPEVVGAFTDPVDQEAALEWLRDQSSASRATSQVIGSESVTITNLQETLRFGRPEDALAMALMALRDGLLSKEAFLDIHTEATKRIENQWVYAMDPVVRFGDFFRTELESSGAFANDEGYTDEARLTAAAQTVDSQFQSDLSEFLDSPEFVNAGNEVAQGKLLQKFIKDKKVEYFKTFAPVAVKQNIGRTLPDLQNESRTAVSFRNLTGSRPASPPSLKGVVGELPKAVLKVQNAIRDLNFGVPAARTLRDPGGLQGSADYAYRDFLVKLNRMLDNEDLVDEMGKPVSRQTKDSLAAQSLAYAGLLSLDEVLAKSVNTSSSFITRNELKAIDSMLALNPDLDLDDVDVTQVPLRDVAALGLSVVELGSDQYGLKIRPEDREGVEKVRELLRRYKHDASDSNVARYIRHQYGLTKPQ